MSERTPELTLSRVQVYRRGQDGRDRLAEQNLYKLFTRKLEDEQAERIAAQGGHWYHLGGDEIPFEDVPEWVWEQCRDMAPEYRGLYRILLPEEKARGQHIPTFEEQTEFPSDSDLMKALIQLRPEADEDWTAEGLPSLIALRKLLRVHVSRHRVDRSHANFVRPAH